MLTPEKLREMGENTACHSAATSQSSLIPSLNSWQPPLDDALSKQTAFSWGPWEREPPSDFTASSSGEIGGRCACMPNRFSRVRLCDPMNCSPPDSSVHGILQARILEWVAMPSSRGSSQPGNLTRISYVSCIGRPVLYHQHHLGSRSGRA